MTTTAPIPTTASDNLPATTNGAHPALIDTENDPWAGVDDGDWTGDTSASRIPFFALNRKYGYGFIDADTGEMSTEMDFIWLAVMRSRAQWDLSFEQRGANEKPAPDCRSFDGMTPDPASPGRKSDSCTTCPFAKFGPNGELPRCHESFEVMAFIPDSTPGGGRLARFRFGGLALSPARAYRSSFNLRMPKVPPIGFVTRVTLDPVDTDNGKFLVPRFQRLTELTPAQVRPLVIERDQRRADWLADIAESVVSQADADAATPAQAPPADPYYTSPDEAPF